jgi:hypothetical protein
MGFVCRRHLVPVLKSWFEEQSLRSNPLRVNCVQPAASPGIGKEMEWNNPGERKQQAGYARFG